MSFYGTNPDGTERARTDLLPTRVYWEMHGRLAPANPSTSGSRQGLWATPRAGNTGDENAEAWARRNAKGDVHTMPLTMQVKAWATPKASDPHHAGPNMRDSSGNYALPAQVTQWPTVCAGDYRTPPTNSGITGQSTMLSSEHALPKAAGGKLNPRWVETLMGLPVGWTMPSCASPVTIAPTNSDCLATESCQQ